MQLVNSAILSFFIRLRTERGQDLLEYAMLGGLIAAAIAAIVAAGVFSGAVTSLANGISDCIDFDPATACTGGL